MKRTSFKRPQRIPQQPAPLRPVRAVAPTVISDAVVASPKTEYYRDKKLLALAEGKPCLLNAVASCCGLDGSSTVACHSNQSKHGKGRSIKAHDTYTVWGCAHCHAWLDGSYSASKAERVAAFDAGHIRQVAEWGVLLASGCEVSRRAVAWFCN